MSELRINRPVSRIHNVQHNEDWNSSFWRYSMPKYNSLLDKHCRRPFSSSRPGSSNRSMRMKPQSSRNQSNKSRKINNQLSIMKEELASAWDSHSVPQQHRELFYNSGKTTPHRISKEIDSLHRGRSMVLKVCEHIHERERLIAELRDNLNSIEKVTETIKLYRNATLEAFEYIAAWTQSLKQNSYEFNWNGSNYLEKAKSDMNFIINSEVGKQLKLNKNDIFLIENNVKLGPSTMTRIKALKRHLKLTPTAPRRLRVRNSSKKISLSVEESAIKDMSEIFQRAEVIPKIIKWIPGLSFLDSFAEEYFEKVLEEYTDRISPGVAFKSFNEMLNAALSLHSSSILDVYLTESLATLIPEVEREALQEERNQEYIGIRDLVFTQVIEEGIAGVIKSVFAEITSKDMADMITECLDLMPLVQEAYQEEIKHSQEIIYVVFDNLIELFLDQEWLEEFVEAEFGLEQLSFFRIQLPSHIQRKIFVELREELLDKTVEDIYFDILNDFVGGFWTEGVTRSAVAELEGEDEFDIDDMLVLQDPNIDIEEFKKDARRRSMYSRILF